MSGERRPRPTNCEHSLRELCYLLSEMGFSLYQDDSVENAEWEGYRLIDPEGEEHPIDAYTFFDLGVCGL